MGDEIRWNRTDFEPRLESLASEKHEYVDAVLDSINYDDARADPRLWWIVCQFFEGAGTDLDYIMRGADAGEIECDENQLLTSRTIQVEGYFEFMDWLSNSLQYRPTRLRPMLEQAASEASE